MPKLLETFCDNLVKKSQYRSDPNAYMHCSIAVIAGLLGNLIKVEGEDIYPNLYSMLLGDTGQGKSSYAKKIKSYVAKIQNRKNRLSGQEAKRRKEFRESELKRKKQCADSGTEYIESKQAPYPTGVYYEPLSFFADDATTEASLEYASKVSWGNMCLFKDELGGFFDSFRKAGREEDQTTYNTLYQPDITYEIRRKMKEAKVPIIHYPVMNLMGCTTNGTITEIIASYKKKKRHDGILSRFQHIYILEPITKEKLIFKEKELVDEDFDKDFIGFLETIINQQILVSKMKKAHENSDEEEDKDFITYIGRTDEAQKIFIDYASSLNMRMFESNHIMFKEHLNRVSDFVLKIALIFHAEKRFMSGVDIFYQHPDNKVMASTMSEAIEYTESILKQVSVLHDEYRVAHDVNSQAMEIFHYISNKSGSFYKKNRTALWSCRTLGDTQIKILPRKNNNCVDRDSLQDLLNLLVENGKIYCKEEENQFNKTITYKYSFFPIEEAKTKEETISSNKNVIPFTKEKPQLEVTIYPTKEENTAHLQKLKSTIDAREFIGRDVKLKNGIGLCPFHDDRNNPNLSVTADYFNCFACGAKGSIIDFTMKYKGLDLSSSIKLAEEYADMKLEPKKVRLIDQTWQEAILKPVQASYLKNRLNDQELSIEAIRYSASVYYKHGNHMANYPAMLAKITNRHGEFIGLHRTYLNDDLSKKRDLGKLPNKKILGDSSGGYVNLIDDEMNTTLIIGEGIETVLSLYLMKKDDLSHCSVYSNLSATNLPDLPDRFIRIIVAQDNDEAGMAYVQKMQKNYGDKIEIEIPNEEYKDFNNVLRGEAV